MKFSSSVITPRGGLRLVAVLVFCCSILVHISAMDENMEGQRREDQNSNRVSHDGATRAGEKQFLHRVRRSVNKNASSSLPYIEKRLKVVEERYVTPLRFRCFSVSKQQFIRINLLIDLISFWREVR